MGDYVEMQANANTPDIQEDFPCDSGISEESVKRKRETVKELLGKLDYPPNHSFWNYLYAWLKDKTNN